LSHLLKLKINLSGNPHQLQFNKPRMGIQEIIQDSACFTKQNPFDWLNEPSESLFGETPRVSEFQSRYRLLVLRINLVSWIDHHRRLLELFRNVQEELIRRGERILSQRQNRENQNPSPPQSLATNSSEPVLTVTLQNESSVLIDPPIKTLKKRICKKIIICQNLFYKRKARESIKLGTKKRAFQVQNYQLRSKK